jgi:hypothetical protein
MLKLYTDESPGLRVDPVVVLVLSLGFIFSVVGLHGKKLCFTFKRRRRRRRSNRILMFFFAVIAKVTRKFSA